MSSFQYVVTCLTISADFLVVVELTFRNSNIVSKCLQRVLADDSSRQRVSTCTISYIKTSIQAKTKKHFLKKLIAKQRFGRA